MPVDGDRVEQGLGGNDPVVEIIDLPVIEQPSVMDQGGAE